MGDARGARGRHDYCAEHPVTHKLLVCMENISWKVVPVGGLEPPTY